MNMIQDLAQLDKANFRMKLGTRADHDFATFEKKKNEVNKELIKLQ